MIWVTNSTSSRNTEKLGGQVGAKLEGGEVIELISDLGGGKTTFVKGLAEGAGASDQVTSPTFTLSNQYSAGDLVIYHFDFYRLAEAGIMKDELAEAIADPDAVVVVEWGEIVADVLPAARLTINIIASGENSRRFEIDYPEKLEYLLPK